MKLPDTETVRSLAQLLRKAAFPHVYGADERETFHQIRMKVEGLAGKEIATSFIDSLAETRRLLESDVEAVLRTDPSASGKEEIILCYPATEVMVSYRNANTLKTLGLPVVPRMLTEFAHSVTGIDIHPGAVIGEYFCIDHGTGIVIGETAVIGNHVSLYQGVTLGANRFVNEPRHPILEDNVTVYSNASILGRVRIGHDSVIGGNVWLTHDVPAYSKILQGKTIERRTFQDGEGI